VGIENGGIEEGWEIGQKSVTKLSGNTTDLNIYQRSRMLTQLEKDSDIKLSEVKDIYTIYFQNYC